MSFLTRICTLLAGTAVISVLPAIAQTNGSPSRPDSDVLPGFGPVEERGGVAHGSVQPPAPALTHFTPGDLASSTGLLTIRKRVDEVNLVFTVTDEGGRFVSNLAVSDLRLLDNRLPPQSISYFQQQTDLPLRVGLVIDLSDSIRPHFKFEKKAATTFLRKILRPQVDRAFIVGFDSAVWLAQDLTGNIEPLASAVERLKTGGETALYDAVVFACNMLRNESDRTGSRRAIILISDGVNTRGRAIMYDAAQAALRAGVIIFALSTNDLAGGLYPQGQAVLDLLTEPTGGRVLPARHTDQISSAFKAVEKQLRSQYAMGYRPAELRPDGSYRPIQLLPRRPDLRVQVRRGYYAPRETEAAAARD